MLRADARILVVDGQVAVARLVARIFGMAGLPNAEVAFDTLTARRQIEALPPDIVVIDAHVAPTRVTAFITSVRRLTGNRALTLLMTTSLKADVVAAAAEAGIDGVLLKPFTPTDLGVQLGTLAARRPAPRMGSRGPLRPDVAPPD